MPRNKIHRIHQFAEEAAQERYEAAVAKILDCLDERERGIIERRYGLGRGSEPQTLQEIGEELGVSKERVRQLETRALAKLREVASDKKIEMQVG